MEVPGNADDLLTVRLTRYIVSIKVKRYPYVEVIFAFLSTQCRTWYPASAFIVLS